MGGRGREKGSAGGGRKVDAHRDVTACTSVCMARFEMSPRHGRRKKKKKKNETRKRGRRVNRYCVILELFIAK